MSAAGAAQLKSCCAAAYGSPAADFLVGESLHPGGLALTRRLADALGLHAGQSALDVASGRGTTALLLASEYGANVQGVDLSEASVKEAAVAARRAGLDDRVTFQVADAEHLPLEDETFDVLVCECSWCLLPDKERAAAEFARVLKPGGRVGIADVTVGPAGVPDDLANLPAWIACLTDARTSDQYSALLAAAGLLVIRREEHSGALAELVGRIEARLRLARALAGSGAPLHAAELARGVALAEAAARAIERGALGYCLLVAQREH